MQIHDKKLVNRWNKVMNSIGCEHLTIDNSCSELETKKKHYDVEDGIDIGWMYSEAEYWLSCYYEVGNVRCNDRFFGEEEYKIWVSETGMLKRLIKKLESMENCMVVTWE